MSNISEAIAGITGRTCNRCAKNFAPRKLNGMCYDCAEIEKYGILIGIASNQAGVSLGYLTEYAAYQLLKDLFITITDRWPIHGLLQVCPHPVNGGCDCRKPAPGMLLKIMRVAQVSPDRTLYVGDMESDEQAAKAAGVDFQWAKDFFSAPAEGEGE
jgi:D-glycero-D-manno-heptose 1,7-bisphosphate phosphatase